MADYIYTQCMAAQVKVSKRGPGLLWPRLNAGPVCDNSTTEGKC